MNSQQLQPKQHQRRGVKAKERRHTASSDIQMARLLANGLRCKIRKENATTEERTGWQSLVFESISPELPHAHFSQLLSSHQRKKRESVDLALQLLDGYDLRGHRLSVERAQFQMKGTYDPSRKPKRRRKKDKEKIKKMQEKLFAWQPDKLRGERAKHERVVIIKNLFEPQIFDKEVALILEYQQELREECLKCGDVRRVVIYDRHPEGVAQVTFKEPEAADACIQLLNGRWYNKRKITAETWDGKTKYKIVETEEEVQKRLKKWEQFLESEEGKKASEAATDKNPDNESATASEGNGTENKPTCQEEKNSESKHEDSTGDSNNQEKSDKNDSCGESDADTEDEDGDESKSVKKGDGRSH